MNDKAKYSLLAGFLILSLLSLLVSIMMRQARRKALDAPESYHDRIRFLSKLSVLFFLGMLMLSGYMLLIYLS